MNRPVCRSFLSECLISTQIAQSGDGKVIDLGQTRGIEKGSVPKQTSSDELLREGRKIFKKDKGAERKFRK